MNQQIVVAGEMTAVFAALPAGTGGQELYLRRGGSALQTALALCRLGAPCAMAGQLCADPLGRALLADAEKAGVETGDLELREGRTGFCIQDEAGRELACCPGQWHAAPALESNPEKLRPGTLVWFSAQALQQEEYRRLYGRLGEEGGLLVLCCTACEELPAVRLCGQADILYLDEPAARRYGEPQVLLQGRTQAVLALARESVSLTTAQGTLTLPAAAAPPQGEPLFGAAALLCQLYEADMERGGLARRLADASFTGTLLRGVAALRCLSVHQSEQLRAAFLHAAEGAGQMLAFAQRKMEEAAPRVAQSPWRLQYHIAAPSGWINDPNGLIQMEGVYHVFYQLHPFSPEWGPMYWGHASSRDLAHWRHEPIALAPDQPYEAGCFSGSAVNDGGVLTLVYTAHNDGNAVKECQCVARSRDGGRTFVKSPANPVIPRYPKDGSADFRDPKVWRQDGRWQMVVGSAKHKKGRALLYASDDLEHWDYRGVLCESDGTQGTMWECPNVCRVDGRDLLIFSPMEMKGHKNVYAVGNLDCKAGKFTHTGCRELDHGLNFYAAQVFEDERGRTLLIAWMDRWGADFPTQPDGWAGALTLPRALHLRGDMLLQQPVPELAALREACLQQGAFTLRPGENPLRELKGDCLEIFFRFTRASARKGFVLDLRASAATGRRAQLVYDGEAHAFSLSRGLVSGKERTHGEFVPCSAQGETVDVHIFIDRCSLEIFIDEGALCFTQRVYPAQDGVFYGLSADGLEVVEFEAWRLGGAFEDK